VSRVLITGGAGFIGGHLCRYLLDRGDEVVVVDDLSRGVVDRDFSSLLTQPRLEFVQANLLEREALSAAGGDFHQVFHFAAIIGVANVLRRPYEVLTNNVAMHMEALRFAKQQPNLQRFVFASTSEVYAGTLQYFGLPLPTPESTPLAVSDLAHPRTSYMLSKIYGEAMCQQAGIPFTVIRPHNVYGPRMGMAHVIPELLKKGYEAPSGSRIEVASVDHRRAFCYIDDAIELIVRGADSDLCRNEVINVGNEQGETSIGELARALFEVLDKNLEVEPGPLSPGSPPNRCPDMTKAVAKTGYQPQIALSEGIRRTFEWYRAQVFESKELTAR
jgi:UDP-glucose 4-epimerase